MVTLCRIFTTSRAQNPVFRRRWEDLSHRALLDSMVLKIETPGHIDFPFCFRNQESQHPTGNLSLITEGSCDLYICIFIFSLPWNSHSGSEWGHHNLYLTCWWCFKMHFIKVWFTQNKMHPFAVYREMSFDKFIYPYSHHHNQDIEHLHHTRKSPCSLCSKSPSLPRPRQAWSALCP